MAWSEMFVPAGSALLGAIVGTGGAILGDHVRHKKAMEAEWERSRTNIRLDAFSAALNAIEEIYMTIRAEHEQYCRRAKHEGWDQGAQADRLLAIADAIDLTMKSLAARLPLARLVGGDCVRKAIVAYEKKLAELPSAIHAGRAAQFVESELDPLHDELLAAMQEDIPLFHVEKGDRKNG